MRRSSPRGGQKPRFAIGPPSTIGRCGRTSTSSSGPSSISSPAAGVVEPTDPGTSRSSSSAISSGCSADGGPTAAPDRRPGPARGGQSRDPASALGRLPRRPSDPPPLAARAREAETDLAQDRSARPATDRSCDPRRSASGSPGRTPDGAVSGSEASFGSSAFASARRDPDPAPNGPSGSRPTTDRPNVDRVPPGKRTGSSRATSAPSRRLGSGRSTSSCSSSSAADRSSSAPRPRSRTRRG